MRLESKEDQVWAVFDKDDILINDFNALIKEAEKNDVYYAYSIEAFELWYLLHFEYLNTGIPRADYCKKLTKHLGIKYKKNMTDIYSLLIAKQNTAIKYAEKLFNSYDSKTSPGNRNPSTTVFKLIIELNKMIEK